MIVHERPNLFQVVFSFRNSVLRRIYPQLLAILALSIAVVWGHRRFPDLVPVFGGAPFALLGLALSIFLSFRNNACYERWWEARKQWGLLATATRDLARQTLILDFRDDVARGGRRDLLRIAIGFAHALEAHLRKGVVWSPRLASLPDDLRLACEASRHRPNYLLSEMGERLARLRHFEQLDSVEFKMIDATLREMNGVLVACERLRTSPVPFGYTLLLLRTAYLFCFCVPFGFADVLGWVTPAAAAVIGYTFFGLEALGDELEEPFGDRPNDLPIHALAVDIEITLKEALGEGDLPAPPKPVRNVLL